MVDICRSLHIFRIIPCPRRMLNRFPIPRPTALAITYAIISRQSAAHKGPPMPTKQPSISAVFPAYSDGGTIGSLVVAGLASLAELTDDYEVIVVENGST